MARPSVVIPVNELNKFDLPPVCVITGQTGSVSFQPVKFSWYPRWVAVFFGCALPIAVVLMVVLTKRVQGELPFSEEGYARWMRKKLVGRVLGFAAFACIIGFFAASAAGSAEDGLTNLAAILGVGFFGFVFAAIITNAVMPGVLCTRIAEEHITLSIPSREAAEQIEAHLHADGDHPPSAAGQVA